jgi:hypothetical protein
VKREIFLEEFWKCFRRLEDTADEMVGKAAYFRFLTLLGRSTHALALFKSPRITEVLIPDA